MLTLNVFNLTIGTLSVFGPRLQGTHMEDLPGLSINLTDTHRGSCSCPTDLYNVKICPAKDNCWNTTEGVIYHATPDGQCTAYISCDHPPYNRLTVLQTDGELWSSSHSKVLVFFVCKNGEWRLGKRSYKDYNVPFLHVVCDTGKET
ncbi:unnamed protein product [Cylicocyclus nassatus]|uniref:Uncharacterized protein n=1 Tax=Cylicocyclus nassatus TaxID=53992 RepID=A0AA36GY40_CYLNA|nr:unnamed protein product [Cylicocyclus nassatus]